MKKVTLIGMSNGIGHEIIDGNNVLNVEMAVKVVETRERNGESVTETEWVRVTAVGNTAEKIKGVSANENVFIEGVIRVDEIPGKDGRISHYMGVSAFKAIKVGNVDEHYISIIADGNLGGDPEMKYTPNGSSVTEFSLPMKHRGDEPLWGTIVCWNKMGENANSFLNKGRGVLVDGKPSLNRWTDKDGQPKARFTVTANELVFLGRGQQGQSGGMPESGTAAAGGRMAAPPPAQAAQPAQAAPAGGYNAGDDQPW